MVLFPYPSPHSQSRSAFDCSIVGFALLYPYRMSLCNWTHRSTDSTLLSFHSRTLHLGKENHCPLHLYLYHANLHGFQERQYVFDKNLENRFLCASRFEWLLVLKKKVLLPMRRYLPFVSLIVLGKDPSYCKVPNFVLHKTTWPLNSRFSSSSHLFRRICVGFHSTSLGSFR